MIYVTSDPRLTPGGSIPGSAANLAQVNWYIDPTNGVDTNTGLSSGAALKTWAELQARWGLYGTLTNPVLKVYGGPNATLGSGATATQTGALSSVVNITRSTNTPNSAVDVALSSWTSVLNTRMRLLTGASAGSISWPVKDLGGGAGAAAVRLGPFTIPTSGTVKTITSGDTYQLETLISCTPGEIDVAYQSKSAGTTSVFILSNLPSSDPINVQVAVNQLWFQDLQFNDPPSFILSIFGATAVTTLFLGCKLGAAILISAPANFYGCGFPGTSFVDYAQGSAYIGCSIVEPLFRKRAGVAFLSSDTIFQGGFGAMADNGALVVNAASMFDATALAGVNPRGSGAFAGGGTGINTITGQCSITVTAANALYGSGNAGYGLEAQAGRTVSVVGAQYITGTLGDLCCGADAANLRAFNNTTGLYSATVAGTWANFSTTVAGGGFGGNVHNVEKNSHIITIS